MMASISKNFMLFSPKRNDCTRLLSVFYLRLIYLKIIYGYIEKTLKIINKYYLKSMIIHNDKIII
jgi:hypothetical protein